MGRSPGRFQALAGVLLVNDRIRRPAGIVFLIALVVGVNFFWADFVRKERTLYAWDHVAYWSLTASLAEGLRTDPVAALTNVGRSVAEDELNLVPSLPLAPSLALFGAGRKVWILTVLNLFALPALFLGWWALRRWGARPGHRWNAADGLWCWAATVLLFAPLWEPVALGYLDIGGMALIFAALGLLAGLQPEGGRDTVLAAVSVGILVAVVMIFRRWYAFWSVSFCIMIALAGLAAWVRTRRVDSLRLPVAIGSGVVGSLALLAGPRLATIAGTDYADRFVHYKVLHSTGAELRGVVMHFGIVTLLAVLIGTVVLLRSRNGRWIAAALVFQLVVIAVLFRRVQDPTPQHWYLLIPGMMLLTAGGFQALLSRMTARTRTGIIAGLLACGVLVTGTVFGAWKIPAPLLPSVRVVPKRRGDIEEFKRLMTFLDGRVRMGVRWIYILAGSGEVNDSSLAFINFSLGTRFESPRHILMTAQVDRRDGFPAGLLEADLVVLPLPVAVRGAGETQRVVAVPAGLFLDGDGIARAFAPLEERFSFDDGVTVRVFERVRRNSPEEIEDLSDRLKTFYPDRPEIWMAPQE